MALHGAFQGLRLQLQLFHDALFGARMTVIEDRPLLGDSALVDQFGDALEDALGWLEEMLLEVEAGEQALVYPVDMERARYALTACQASFNRLTQRLGGQAASYRCMADLTQMGQSRGGEWQSWAESVRDAMDRCMTPSYEINNALFLCWQDMLVTRSAESNPPNASRIVQQGILSESRELTQQNVS